VSAIFQTAAAFSALAVGIGAIVGAVALVKAAMAAFGLSAAALSLAGGPITLAIAGIAALTAGIIYLREKSQEPFRVRVITNAAEAGAELARLSVLREQLQSDLDAKSAKAKAAPRLSPIGRAISDAVEFSTGIPLPGDKEARAAVNARKRVAELDAQLKSAAETAKAFVTGSGGTFDPLADSAKKAKDDVTRLLEAIAKASLPASIDIRKALAPDLTLRPPRKEPNTDLTTNGPIDGGELKFGSAAIAESEKMLEVATAIGLTVEQLNDSLVKAGAQFDTFSGNVVIFGEALKDAFSRAFDPVASAIYDANKAVFDLTDSVGGALSDAFQDLTKGGKSFSDAMVGALEKIRDAVIQLIGQIVLAIAKMAILNALKKSTLGPVSFFVSAGGEVEHAVRGGSVAALAGGGSIRGAVPTLGLAHGGAMIHAASGLRVVPGSPQAFDSVPAMLAPGEVVLPTIGGRMPGDILAGLSQLGKDVTTLMARSFMPQMQPAFAGGGSTYNVSTIDADGFRSFLRDGAMARENGLASDPARD